MTMQSTLGNRKLAIAAATSLFLLPSEGRGENLGVASAPAQNQTSLNVPPKNFANLDASPADVVHTNWQTPSFFSSLQARPPDAKTLAAEFFHVQKAALEHEKNGKSFLEKGKEKLQHLLENNWFAAASIGLLGFLAYKKWFINRLTINSVSLCTTVDAEGKESHRIQVRSSLEAHPYKVFGLDLFAFSGFHSALWNAVRKHPELPILQFPARGGYERVLKYLRKIYCTSVLSFKGVEDVSELAARTLLSKDKSAIPVEESWARTSFLTFTFEPEETTEPRGLYIPASTILSVIGNYPTWWKAAHEGPLVDRESSKRKVLALIESSVNIFYRGAGLFERLCPGITKNPYYEKNLQAANGNLSILLPLFAKNTEDSITYLDKIVQHGTGAAEPIDEELQRAIFKSMYRNDPASPEDLFQRERRYNAGDENAYEGIPVGELPYPTFVSVIGTAGKAFGAL